MTGVKERPILFSGPMVRALLDGRKSQTRRVVKPQPPVGWDRTAWSDAPTMGWTAQEAPARDWHIVRCPYGTIGDRLWVRETFFDNCPGERDMEQVYYRADGEPDFDGESITRDGPGWTPSIHMPRWASRLTLEITGVRVERVQDISEADARAEGAESRTCRCTLDGQTTCSPGMICEAGRSDRDWYRDTWDSINGKRPGCSWADNPFVWVLEFRRVNAEACND